jgi:hypothetical protein
MCINEIPSQACNEPIESSVSRINCPSNVLVLQPSFGPQLLEGLGPRSSAGYRPRVLDKFSSEFGKEVRKDSGGALFPFDNFEGTQATKVDLEQLHLRNVAEESLECSGELARSAQVNETVIEV